MMIPKLLNNVLRRLYKSYHLIKQKSYYKGKYYLHEGNGNEDLRLDCFPMVTKLQSSGPINLIQIYLLLKSGLSLLI